MQHIVIRERTEVKLALPQDDFYSVVTYRTDAGEFNVFQMRDGSRKAYVARDRGELPFDHPVWAIVADEHFELPERVRFTTEKSRIVQ
jgi:hypothetical protein